jgi:hypothetical protein
LCALAAQCERLTALTRTCRGRLFTKRAERPQQSPSPHSISARLPNEDNAAGAPKEMSEVEPELAPVPLRLGRSAPPGEGGELLRLHVPQKPSRSLGTSREDTPRVNPGVRHSSGRKRRGLILWHGERLQARDEQPDIFERRLLVLIQVEAEPASGEAPVTVRLLPCHQRCQLEPCCCCHVGAPGLRALCRYLRPRRLRLP